MTVRKQNNVRDNETEPWKDHGQGSQSSPKYVGQADNKLNCSQNLCKSLEDGSWGETEDDDRKKTK